MEPELGPDFHRHSTDRFHLYSFKDDVKLYKLNQQQRDFLINVVEKVVTYLATIAVVGKGLDKSLSTLTLVIFGGLVVLLIIFALWLRRGES